MNNLALGIINDLRKTIYNISVFSFRSAEKTCLTKVWIFFLGYATTMSLKVNVIYKGIIYRVKGMKVLCLVILTVILLLFALVAMGAWMLINFHAESAQFVMSSNSTSKNLGPNPSVNLILNTPPSIEFGNSQDIVPSTVHKTPGKLTVQDIGLIELNRQRPESHHFSEIYGSVFYDIERKDTEKQTFSQRDKLLDREIVLENRSQPEEDLNTPKSLIKETPERISPGLISKSINAEMLSDNNNQSHETNEHSEFERQNERSKGAKPGETSVIPGNEELHPLWKKKTTQSSFPTTKVPTTLRHELFQRNGLLAKNIFTYIGPPVVGYGSNPYEIMTKERINEYDNFWRTYGNKNGNESNLSLNKASDFSMDDTIWKEMRPRLRGLSPSGVGYDIQIGPTSQASYTRTVSSSLAGNYSSGSALRNQPALNASIPHVNNLRRKLYMGIQKTQAQPQPSQFPTTTARPNLISIGPLQGLYDYSKKLAASLLSFNSKSADKIQNSSQRLGEYGINLIENHNEVFKQPFNGPLDRIVALIPSAERLRSLDPFELSLITWTFLDYWEFLIEKVGTLSDEDLTLLQQRLDRLRKRKDNAMTRVLVNETLNHYSSGKQRSISDGASLNFNFSGQLMTPNNGKATSKEEILNKNHQLIKKREFDGKILSELFSPLPNVTNGTKFLKTRLSPSRNNSLHSGQEENQAGIPTVPQMILLMSSTERLELKTNSQEEDNQGMVSEGRSSLWDPLGLFTSKARIEFMQFAVKVLFNFGKICLRKPYALDCTMLLYCKDLNQDTKKKGLDAVAAKLKSVGLKVLTESEQQLRQSDTFGQVWRSVTAWTPLQCDVMFPRCDGPKALEIVNEVAMGNQ